jgi:hypothetical protein
MSIPTLLEEILGKAVAGKRLCQLGREAEFTKI